MAFPSSPVNNQLATVNGITFTYNSTKGAWLRASTAGANLTANSLTITSNTVSVSTTSGALLVTGGAGIQGNLNIGGRLTVGTGIVSAANVTSAAFTPLLLQSNAGVTAVTIDTSQNVGIGVTSPGSKLGVLSSVGAWGMRVATTYGTNDSGFYFDGSGNAQAVMRDSSGNNSYITNTSNNMQFATGGTERMRIDSSGNVGIGNTAPLHTLSVNGNVFASGTIQDSKGDVRAAPINTQSGAYIAVATDAGKTIYISTGGVTINASIFSAGDMVTIVNNSGSSQTITAGTSVTFRLAGTATTGNRTLAQYGMCTFLCVVGGASPTFICSGGGLT